MHPNAIAVRKMRAQKAIIASVEQLSKRYKVPAPDLKLVRVRDNAQKHMQQLEIIAEFLVALEAKKAAPRRQKPGG